MKTEIKTKAVIVTKMKSEADVKTDTAADIEKDAKTET